MATLQAFTLTGWYETNSEGIATIYLAITDEAMVTSPTDTPANTLYKPRVLNAEQFSIKRAPAVWMYGQTTVQGAAFGQLQIDNYDGAFDFLVSADLRDTTVVLSLPAAASLLTGTTIANAPLIATGIIDTVSSSSEDVIIVSFKDAIARLDKPLPCRFNPPYVDSAAANQIVPITLGACRNVAPLLIDSTNRIYELSDSQITNVTSVTDKGAPLDPNASPPQYTSALSGTGLQLAVLPQGLLACDCSSVGQQSVLPGIPDVLNGAGAFPGTIFATTLASAWLGQAGYGTTSTAVPTGTGPYTVAVNNTGSPPANGTQVYITDGTNKLLGTISSSTTTSIVITKQDSAGTITSIASGSTLVQTGAPTGFTYTQVAVSGNEILNPPKGYLNSTNGFLLTSSNVFQGGTSYADHLDTTAILTGGVSYRISFGIAEMSGCSIHLTNAQGFGIIVTTALSAVAKDYVTGYIGGTPGVAPVLSVASNKSQTYSYEYTVPAGAARKLYFILTASDGGSGVASGTSICTLFNIKIEQLGQFSQLPLAPISMTDYFTEILVNRAAELSTVFNSTDTAALAIRDVTTTDGAAGSLIPFGCHFDQPPNILDALRMALDSFGACLFTDNTGALRCKRLTDPSNPVGRTIKCDFDTTNILRPIDVISDNASGLTTLIGARRNWKVYSANDFVTDQNIVTQDVKARYMRLSQYQQTSSRTPAGQYSFAIGAPIFDSVIDIANDAQLEIDRVMGIWSPNVYSDGTTVTGKRRIVTFTAFFDDPLLLGVATQIPATSLMFGDIISITYPTPVGTVRFNATPAAVLETELFPFAKRITIKALI